MQDADYRQEGRDVLLEVPVGMSRQEWYRTIYLQSDHWKATRAAALLRSGNRCQLCSKGSRLDVHHNDYTRLGAEEPFDVVVLCRSCHEHHHEKAKAKKPRKASERGQWRNLDVVEQKKLADRVLRMLYANDHTSKWIAHDVGQASQMVDSCLVALKKRGLVRKLPHTKVWRLTQKGRDGVDKAGTLGRAA